MFGTDEFKEEKTMLISCFLHFADSAYLDPLHCLHYNGPVYYQMCPDDNTPYANKNVACGIEKVRENCWSFFRDLLFKNEDWVCKI